MVELPPPPHPLHEFPTVPKASILLVDDHPANLLSLRAILDELGKNLVEARSGEEALERTASQEFAAVLMDVVMPGMSGYETARLIRQRAPHTPIIFLTANDIEPSRLEEGYALGAVDFLIKPFLPFILRAKVRGLVEIYEDKQQAQHEADQLRLLVQGTADYALFLLDPAGNVLTWNLGAERLNGYKADEIIGEHFSRFYPAEAIQQKGPQHELKVAEQDGRFEDEGWRLRKDGSRFWANVIITPLFDELGSLRGFSKVTRDLTERRQAREALRYSEERFRILVEGAKDYALFLLDPQGHVVTWNPGAERIKQYRAEEIVGQHFSRFYPPEAIASAWPEHELKVAAEKGNFEDEGWRVRKDGSYFWANVIITALRDEAGELRGFSKITRDMTDRKRAEESARRLLEETTARRVAEENSKIIQEQRERLHVTLASIGDGVISTNAAGKVDFLNSVAASLIGCTNEEAIGKPLTEIFRIVQETTREPVQNPAIQAIREKRTISLANHTLLLTLDGLERPIDDSAAPIRDTEGNVIGSVLVFRDISDRRQSQVALRQSEARFRGLMEQAPFSIHVFSADGRLQRVNRAWEKLWGLTLAQIPDYNILEDPQLERKGVLPFIQQALAGEVVTIPAIAYDMGNSISNSFGELPAQRWVSAVAYPLQDEAGNVREVVLVHDDITSRKRTEEERERFAFLVENSRDFIALYDQNFVPIFVNREGMLMIGLESLEQVRKTEFSSLFFSEDRKLMTQKFFPQVLREGYGEMEVRFRNLQTGQPIWLSYSAVVMRDAMGAPAGLATIGRDITRLKEANFSLQELDRRKDEFVATLAHELRNPLAPIRNSLQILSMPQVDVTTAKQVRDMMERQVHHLVRLVDDLLDVSRIMRGKIELRKEPVELATIVARAVETAHPLIEMQGHRLDISMPPESLLLNADPVRLTQVVGNLLTNAAKYSDANGHIWLTAHREAGDAVLRIRDRGIGIAPDMLPHVFELFVQADHATTKAQGGLGIGLTLVKNLVELHRGSVEARSEGLGKGCEFAIRLPLEASRATSATETADATTLPASSGHRLLVVDDNLDAAVSLSTLLRLQGHEVRIAHNGLAALELAKDFRPDMIFLDLGMPGMDGYEVARTVRRMPGLANTILAALTGWGQKEDRRRTTEAGFDYHLVKPLESKTLEHLLSELKHKP